MSIEINDDGAGWGVRGNSKTGIGVVGLSDDATGVAGGSKTGDGVRAVSIDGRGIWALAGGDAIVGQSGKRRGVVGISLDEVGVSGESTRDNGVLGQTHAGSGAGVFGLNDARAGGNGVTGLAKGAGGTGVFGSATLRGVGVIGNGATGMVALGDSGHGLSAASEQQHGVTALAKRKEFAGVRGEHAIDGTGVRGESVGGRGVEGVSQFGVWGACDSEGPRGCGVVGVRGAEPPGGWTPTPAAICALTTEQNTSAIVASCPGGVSQPAIQGECTDPASMAAGVHGKGPLCGVRGEITSSTGSFFAPAAVQGQVKYAGHVAVRGIAEWSATGVHGRSESGVAVIGWCSGTGTGVYGFSPNSTNVGGYAFAGMFHGAVNVTGPVHKSGGGFLIDHPQDPASKFLSHSFVESDERKNIYDGVVELGDDGAAEVVLPAWFEAVNTSIRYQLTALGRAAPDLHVERELTGCKFRIAGGHKSQRICWQVTGRRADAWAEANPQVVEIDKSGEDRGFYRHPELFGFGREKSFDRQQREAEPQREPREDLADVLQALRTGTLGEEAQRRKDS